MPMARHIRSPAPMPKNSRANIRTGSSLAASGTICLRKPRRPLRRPSSTPPKADRRYPRTYFQSNHDLTQKEHTMTQANKVLYTAKTHPTGGRDGASRSSDGRLDVKLSSPGTAGNGTNPEQMFAAGWSACFLGAMGVAASKMKTRLPADAAIDAEVDSSGAAGEYFLQARLNVSMPGMEREIAQAVVNAAHQTCPYSKATRGNIDV